MINDSLFFFSLVEINLTNEYYVIGAGLEGIFRASKITFHWGKCNASHDGSEHSIDGRKYPLEVINSGFGRCYFIYTFIFKNKIKMF